MFIHEREEGIKVSRLTKEEALKSDWTPLALTIVKFSIYIGGLISAFIILAPLYVLVTANPTFEELLVLFICAVVVLITSSNMIYILKQAESHAKEILEYKKLEKS